MRNLFWRIWSSKRLAGLISNEKLNQLWMRCRRNQAFAPFQLPRAFVLRYPLRPTQTVSVAELVSFCSVLTSQASPTETREQDPYHTEAGSGDGILGSAAGRAERPHPAHLMLADRLSERRSDNRPSQAGRGGSSSASTASTESSSRPDLRRNTSGSKSRPPVVATTSRGRAKPALIRRKSSQNKGQANSERQSEPAFMPQILKTTSQEAQDQATGAPGKSSLSPQTGHADESFTSQRAGFRFSDRFIMARCRRIQ